MLRNVEYVATDSKYDMRSKICTDRRSFPYKAQLITIVRDNINLKAVRVEHYNVKRRTRNIITILNFDKKKTEA